MEALRRTIAAFCAAVLLCGASPQRATSKGPVTVDPDYWSAFRTRTLLADVFDGKFDGRTVDLRFRILFNAYVDNYDRSCGNFLPPDAVEAKRADETLVRVHPDFAAVYKKYRARIRIESPIEGLSRFFSGADIFEMVHPINDMEALFEKEPCQSAILQKLAANLLRFALEQDFQESLFADPESPLYSHDNERFFAGWLLATGSSGTPRAAAKRTAEMLQALGREAFDRGVDAARAFKTVEELRGGGPYPVAPVLIAEWGATRDEPDLYALYLIKRFTYSDWDWAKAAQKARAKRVSKETLAESMRKAFHFANRLGAGCVGDPIRQDRNQSSLYDCVAIDLGPLTIWNDAYDVSIARMNAGEMRSRMLRVLRGSPGSGTPETRYKRLTGVISEPVLLAALHHMDHGALESMVHTQRRLDTRPFEEELRLMEVFAAIQDERSFAVLSIARDDDDGSYVEKLENAVATYEQLVTSQGAEAVRAASKSIRDDVLRLGKDLEELPIFAGYGDLFLQSLGVKEPPPAAFDFSEMRARGGKLMGLTTNVRFQFLGPLYTAIGNHHLRQGLSVREARRHAVDAMSSAAADADATVNLLDKYETTRDPCDLRTGLQHGYRTLEQIRLAYEHLRRIDPKMDTLLRIDPSTVPWSQRIDGKVVWGVNLEEELPLALAPYEALQNTAVDGTCRQ